MTDLQARAVVLKSLIKRRWLRTGVMVRKSYDLIDQIPAANPMQEPSGKLFYMDIVSSRRP